METDAEEFLRGWFIPKGTPYAHFMVKHGKAACGFTRRKLAHWLPDNPSLRRCRRCEEELQYRKEMDQKYEVPI